LPKKRLIFVLLYRGGQFCISRNFRLQTVGSAAWLARNYGFAKVSRFIDELVILNAESEPADQTAFLNTAASIAAEVFVPVALGGAIRGLSDAEVYFRHGADKVVVNTLLWKDPGAVKDIADVYGVQAVMASVDYRGLKAPRRGWISPLGCAGSQRSGWVKFSSIRSIATAPAWGSIPRSWKPCRPKSRFPWCSPAASGGTIISGPGLNCPRCPA
jgi:imidazole glycerol phosphate synthase subunit HisF